MATKIEWCDETVNPFVGCSKCSPGCDNCYAEKIAMRMVHNPQVMHLYHGTADKGGWTGNINFNPRQLDKITAWKKPKRIFIGSMSDCFHEKISNEHLVQILSIVERHAHHTFIMLTKRPDIMIRRMNFLSKWFTYPLKNLWLGVTVCNQKEANEKIPVLLSAPAAKHFVSIEPMLGEINLRNLYGAENSMSPYMDALSGIQLPDKLDWVICGGETGEKARPIHSDWVRTLRDQCLSAKVPFFFKSWGGWRYEATSPTHTLWIDGTLEKYSLSHSGGYYCRKARKAITDNIIDGAEYKEFPKMSIKGLSCLRRKKRLYRHRQVY